MKKKELVIQNQTGLHARPAKVLVSLAKQYQSEIVIFHGEKKANAKSMVSVLTLGAGCGSQITLQVTGEDEERALMEIEAAFRAGLGESESAWAAPEAKPAAAPTAARPVVESPDKALGKAPGVALIQGIAASPGIAIGPVFPFQSAEPGLDEAALSVEPQHALDEALGCARVQLLELCQQMKTKKLAAEAAIFEAHIELMDDPELAEAVQARVQAGEGQLLAWKTAVEERATLLAALSNPLLAARADDLRDVGRRVLRLMLGVDGLRVSLPDTPVVITARELSPSDTAAFDPARVLGFGIVNGGPTSHIAILARAIGLPAVVGVDESLLELAEGSQVILNGNNGTLLPNPNEEQLSQAKQEQQRWLEQRSLAQKQADLPATTLDGHHVDVTANAGSAQNAVEALKKGADGIGLLRTEFLFLERTTAPDEDEQFQVYSEIAKTMGTRPVIIRTLDIGGDKPLPYIHLKPEMNPFLGERGIRLCLNRPELFRAQLRAILRASVDGTLRIMFPMVSDIQELRQARALVEEIRGELGVPPVQIGIMVEVPSAALMAEVFAPEIDFFSIGTNDLTQYTLAIDRANASLAAKHDGLHPAVLRLIARTIEGAHRYGKRADLCGELGSDPAAIPVLVGLGLDELSVSIPAVPSVKAQVRSLTLTHVQALAQQALACYTAQEVRELVAKQQTA